MKGMSFKMHRPPYLDVPLRRGSALGLGLRRRRRASASRSRGSPVVDLLDDIGDSRCARPSVARSERVSVTHLTGHLCGL